jgi:hypothetical protein
MGRLIRQPSIDAFVSGLRDMNPLAHEEQPSRTLEQGLEEFLKSPDDKKAHRRRKSYDVPGTPATRRETLRRVGEKDD